MNEVVPAQQAVSVQETLQTARTVQTVMQSIMKKDVHFGVIPGCKQPSLYKAGSEALLSTFRIAVEPIVEEFISRDERGKVREIRYRVKCIGRHIGTGREVGFGVGECSTGEDKYLWRRAVCDEEFAAADEPDKRIKWSKYKNEPAKATKQIRVSPADVSNTVLKMAKKRGQIDLTLTTLGCSDLFAQDLEDLDETIRTNFTDEPVGNPALQKEWVDKANAAKGADDLKIVWQTGLKVIRDAEDMPAYTAFKAAVEAKGKTFPKEAPKDEPPAEDDPFLQEMDKAAA